MRTVEPMNYHVRVHPKTLAYGIPVAEEKPVCEAIIDQIRRHVDDVQLVELAWDEHPICSFCGRNWTEGKDAPHNGGCCAEDETVMNESEPG